MKRNLIPTIGALWTLLFAGFILWLYATAPTSVREAATQFGDSARIATGVYEVDAERFRRGLDLFRREQYAAARDEWRQADPAERDARTQFYIAYSFYREGWGRLYNDDALFAKALETVNRAESLAGESVFTVDDSTLILRTPSELRAEVQAGMTRTWDDINPLKVIRERK